MLQSLQKCKRRTLLLINDLLVHTKLPRALGWQHLSDLMLDLSRLKVSPV
jgi:hypothetical protein